MTTWTEDQIEDLKRMKAGAFTASGMARALGVTRNAVIGKLHRLGLTDQRVEKTLRKPVRSMEEKRERPAGRPSGKSAQATARPPRPRPPARPIEDLAAPISRELSILDLKAFQCRWPGGEGPFTFCGHRTFGDSPYCEYHTRLAYQPVQTRREREAA